MRRPFAAAALLPYGRPAIEQNGRRAFSRRLCEAALSSTRHERRAASRPPGHRDSPITAKVYARWLPDDTRRRGVDRLDETHPAASPAHPARKVVNGVTAEIAELLRKSGEPPRNRAENPQIKSLLLCQLS